MLLEDNVSSSSLKKNLDVAQIYPCNYAERAHLFHYHFSVLCRFSNGANSFNSLSTRDEISEFANSEDLYEPPHLDVPCLPSSL